MPGIVGAQRSTPGPAGITPLCPTAGGAVGVTGGVAGEACKLIVRPAGMRGTTTLGISGTSELPRPTYRWCWLSRDRARAA